MPWCAAVLCGCAVIHAEPPRRTDWFRQARYGVFIHFLGGGEGWNDAVDAFDVEAFGAQMKAAGAGYVILTLGQNTGYYCAPNATYDRYCGYEAGDRCSSRDLPMELVRALAEHGIHLMLYLPSRSPQGDKNAMASLSDVHEFAPAPQEFTRKWSAVIREWSVRYGKRVRGWWFDGSYNTAGWDDLARPYNWNTWAAACRAGNRRSILGFNPGTDVKKAFSRLCAQQDYTAGEQNKFEVTPETAPAPEGMQWHLLTHLGSSWGRADGPQLSDADMIRYVRAVNRQGGVVSIEVSIKGDGRLYAPHLEQLKALAAALRASSGGPPVRAACSRETEGGALARR